MNLFILMSVIFCYSCLTLAYDFGIVKFVKVQLLVVSKISMFTFWKKEKNLTHLVLFYNIFFLSGHGFYLNFCMIFFYNNKKKVNNFCKCGYKPVLILPHLHPVFHIDKKKSPPVIFFIHLFIVVTCLLQNSFI